MKCTTIREGVDCPFMAAQGCSFNKGTCLVAVEACTGCSRSQQYPTGWYCSSCPDPASKWKHGHCNMATHISLATGKETKAKVNPLKASKRGNR